jgi:hypothetical protein
VLLELARPRTSWHTTKGRLFVEGPEGSPVGSIVRETIGVGGAIATAASVGAAGAPTIAWRSVGGVKGLAVGLALTAVLERIGPALEGLRRMGHARFGLEVGEERLGSIHAENFESWDFSVRDADDVEVGKITKTWAGWVKERFTKSDNYVVQMDRKVAEPLRSLVIAAAVAIDVELKEWGDQTRGSSISGTRRYS